jgi:hypothetical protein
VVDWESRVVAGHRRTVVRLELGGGGRFDCLAMDIELRAVAGLVRCVEGSLSATKANPPRSSIAQRFELLTGWQKF